MGIPTPSRLQGEAHLEQDPRPVQNLKLAPRSDSAPLHPARPAPGQCSQVCEIVQGLIRSEHVQQPDHLGRRPEHPVASGAEQRARGLDSPLKLALCSRQESPLQLSPFLPTVHRAQLYPLEAQHSPGTPAHRCMLFLDGDSLDPLGEGEPQVWVSSQPSKELQFLGPSSPSSCPH